MARNAFEKGVGVSSCDACSDETLEDRLVLPLAAEGCRSGISVDGRVSKDDLLSKLGRVSIGGLEKFRLCEPAIEYSDVMEGDRCIGGMKGE